MVASVTFPVTALASPVLRGTTTSPTGFTGLEVDGITYNVAFTTESYDTTFATIPPTFLGNENGALDTAFALVSALNAAEVTELGDYSFTFPLEHPVGNYYVYVPSEFYSYEPDVFSMYAASTNPG